MILFGGHTVRGFSLGENAQASPSDQTDLVIFALGGVVLGAAVTYAVSLKQRAQRARVRRLR